MKKSEKIAEINNILTASIAAEKAVRAKAEADYRGKVAVLLKMAQDDREKAEDDPYEPQDGDNPTQWLNGEQWSCEVVARRILNKLPKLNSPKETLYVEISPSYLGGCGLCFRYINIINKDGGVANCELTAKDEPEEQARKIDHWMKRVEVEMAEAQEIMRKESEHIDPKLDTTFGGDPVSELNDIVEGVVRKEDDNE